jgi:hypothetical protein
LTHWFAGGPACLAAQPSASVLHSSLRARVGAMNSTTDAEENANELQFGREFSGDDPSLSNDEIYLVMLAKQAAGGVMSEQFEQTFGYIEKVVTTKDEDGNVAVTSELNEKLRELQLSRKDGKFVTLHPFEVGSLANLIKDVSCLRISWRFVNASWSQPF